MAGPLRTDIRSRVQEILNSIKPDGRTQLVLSLGLEDRYSTKAARKLYNYVRTLWPYVVSRSTVVEGQYVLDSSMYEERHGTGPRFLSRKCIFNPDGFTMSASREVLAFRQYRGCLVRYAWTEAAQGIAGRWFLPPGKRKLVINSSDEIRYCKLLRDS